MAVQATLAPMSKGAWLVGICLLLIPFAAFFAPYALRIATHPWAWTRVSKDSLTGVWVGTLSIQANTGDGPEKRAEMPMMLEIHMQMFTWLTHLAGTVKTCQAGVISDEPYQLGDVTMGTVDGDRIKLWAGRKPSFAKVEGVRKDNILTVEQRLDMFRTASGSLHKGSEADFQALCR